MQNRIVPADADLGTAATDIHQSERAFDPVEAAMTLFACQDSERNQLRLFGSGDDPDMNPGAGLYFSEKFFAIGGFPQGTGSEGDDLMDTVLNRESLEANERLERAAGSLAIQLVIEENAGPQSYHDLLAVQPAQPVLASQLMYVETNGVGAQVNDGETHRISSPLPIFHDPVSMKAAETGK
jgi:hypothetical protein